MTANDGVGTEAGVPAKFAMLGLTFDDVLLLPGESDMAPGDIDTGSRIARHVRVNVPLPVADPRPLPENLSCRAG